LAAREPAADAWLAAELLGSDNLQIFIATTSNSHD